MHVNLHLGGWLWFEGIKRLLIVFLDNELFIVTVTSHHLCHIFVGLFFVFVFVYFVFVISFF